MKSYILISFILLLPSLASAQFEFERVPISFEHPDDAYYMQPEGLGYDPRDSSLIISGRFRHVNDSLTNNIVKYKNGQVIYFPYDTALTKNFRYVYYYNDAIYLGGFGLVKIDSNGVTVLDSSSAAIYSFYTYHDTLVIGGQFDAIGGLAHTGGIVGYDGSQFFTMYGYDTLFGPGSGSTVGAISEYNGNLVVGGFIGIGSSTSNKIVVHFDGSNWAPLGNGINAYLTDISVLLPHGGYLYAGGVPVLTHNANQGIARWNGQNWEGLGNPFEGRFNSLEFIGDTLLCAGIIKNTLNHNDSSRALAMYYDGQWCVNMKQYSGYVWDMQAFEGDYYLVGPHNGSFYSDSVATGLSDKDLIRLYDMKFTPNIITSIEQSTPKNSLEFYPNPVRDILYIGYKSSRNKPYQIKIYDMSSRLVLVKNSDFDEVDLSSLPRGCFVVEVLIDNEQTPVSIIIQRE